MTLTGGMDGLPRELVSRFEASGGGVLLGHDLRGFEVLGVSAEPAFRLSFDGGTPVVARRLVLRGLSVRSRVAFFQ